MANEEMVVLTEVGAFGGLEIDDPTVKKVKKANEEDMEKMIQEAIAENASNLTGF